MKLKLSSFKSRVGLCELREVAHDTLKKVMPGMRGQARGSAIEHKRAILPGNKPIRSGLSSEELKDIKDRREWFDKQRRNRELKANVAAGVKEWKEVGKPKWRKRGEAALMGTLGILGSAASLAGGDIEESEVGLLQRLREGAVNRAIRKSIDPLKESRVLDFLKSIPDKVVSAGKAAYKGAADTGADLADVARNAASAAGKTIKHGRVTHSARRSARRAVRLAKVFAAKRPDVIRELQDTANYAGPGGLFTSWQRKPGNISEGGDEVEMPKKEYVREHKHLVKVLDKCKLAACKQEARKQRKEMRKELHKKKEVD